MRRPGPFSLPRVPLATALGALALIAAGVAIFLAIDAGKEEVTASDLNDVRNDLTSLEQVAMNAASDDLEGLSGRIDRLEQKARSQESGERRTTREIKVANDEIEDLRDQLGDAEGRIDDLGTEVDSLASRVSKLQDRVDSNGSSDSGGSSK